MNKYLEINNVLQNIDCNIYICGHIKPDQDSICSCLALSEYLKYLGKNAYVILENKDRNIISWLDAEKPLVEDIKEKDYVFIALDLNEKSRLGKYEYFFDKAKYKINIDHHQDNKYQADYTLSIPNISSTSEIIYNIITKNNKKALNLNICSYLYAGLLGDTNCFTRRLSSFSLSIAQQLINKGIDYIHIINKTFSERSLYEFKALAKLINEIKFDGIYYVTVDQSLEEYKNLTYNDIVKKIAEDLRKINTIDIFLLLIKNENSITAKVMSNKSENANLIANVFGGGGHKKEAGFTVKDMQVEEIITKSKQYLKLI